MSKLGRRDALAAHFRAKLGVSINTGALMSRACWLLLWLLCAPVAAAVYCPSGVLPANQGATQ